MVGRWGPGDIGRSAELRPGPPFRSHSPPARTPFFAAGVPPPEGQGLPGPYPTSPNPKSHPTVLRRRVKVQSFHPDVPPFPAQRSRGRSIRPNRPPRASVPTSPLHQRGIRLITPRRGLEPDPAAPIPQTPPLPAISVVKGCAEAHRMGSLLCSFFFASRSGPQLFRSKTSACPTVVGINRRFPLRPSSLIPHPQGPTDCRLPNRRLRMGPVEPPPPLPPAPALAIIADGDAPNAAGRRPHAPGGTPVGLLTPMA